jgi:MFS family permease
MTTSLYVAAMGWALLVTGPWYLIAFGIYGAGELVGVYAPNYILSASRSGEIRRNMAIVTMMMVPAAPAGTLFGAISDHFGGRHGAATGFRISFAVCAAMMIAGIVLALLRLPRRPQEALAKSPRDAHEA